jgi:hypothetical protein
MLVVFCVVLCWTPSRAQPVVQNPARDTQAGDLTKLDRKIGKEPVYKKSPLYCLVVFGTDTKFRVWVVIDGETLYVDLNGNGDLTEKGEAFTLKVTEFWRNDPPCEVGDLLDPHTKLKHAKFAVGLFDRNQQYQLRVEAAFVNPKVPRLGGYANATFAGKPADAPIVHFGGPLSMGLAMATIEDRPAFVCAEIGTPGIGKGSFVYYSTSVFFAVDAKLTPDLEIEYPGEKNAVVREKAKFHRDGIERVYLYPVVPGEKGDKRQTKITLSFPDWADGKIAPASFSEPLLTLKK